MITHITSPQFVFHNNPAKVALGGTDFQILLENQETSHGVVPKGTINDGPSINPYPLRMIIQPRTMPLSGNWHDLACMGKLQTKTGTLRKAQFTRWTADAILREAVIAEGVRNYFLGREDQIDAQEYERHLKRLNRRAFLVWVGVVIGAKMKYKTVIPPHIVEYGISEYSQRFGISVNKLEFDTETNKVFEV